MPKWWDSERHENKHQDAIHDVRLTSGRADLYDQLIQKERRRRVIHFLKARVSEVSQAQIYTPGTIPSVPQEVLVHTYLNRVQDVSPLFREILADRLQIPKEEVHGTMYPYHTVEVLGQKYYRPETVGAGRSGVVSRYVLHKYLCQVYPAQILTINIIHRATNKRHMMCMMHPNPDSSTQPGTPFWFAIFLGAYKHKDRTGEVPGTNIYTEHIPHKQMNLFFKICR